MQQLLLCAYITYAWLICLQLYSVFRENLRLDRKISIPEAKQQNNTLPKYISSVIRILVYLLLDMDSNQYDYCKR